MLEEFGKLILNVKTTEKMAPSMQKHMFSSRTTSRRSSVSACASQIVKRSGDGIRCATNLARKTSASCVSVIESSRGSIDPFHVGAARVAGDSKRTPPASPSAAEGSSEQHQSVEATLDAQPAVQVQSTAIGPPQTQPEVQIEPVTQAAAKRASPYGARAAEDTVQDTKGHRALKGKIHAVRVRKRSALSVTTTSLDGEEAATHFVLYFNDQTFSGDDSEGLEREVHAAMEAKMAISMVHENDVAKGGCAFDRCLPL